MRKECRQGSPAAKYSQFPALVLSHIHQHKCSNITLRDCNEELSDCNRKLHKFTRRIEIRVLVEIARHPRMTRKSLI
jgi:hypothetical protein